MVNKNNKSTRDDERRSWSLGLTAMERKVRRVKVADLAVSWSAMETVVGIAPTAAETVVGAPNNVVVAMVLDRIAY